MKHLLLLATFCLLNLFTQAQNILSGKVVSQLNSEPLAGATITMEGTYLTEITKPDGTFSFSKFPNGEAVLIIRFLGYTEQKISVNSATTQNLIVEMVVNPILAMK